MIIFNKTRGTKGWITLYNRVLRFRYMITEEAKRKTKILAFWEKYGTETTEEAFGIKRRTLFNWQKRLKEGDGKLESLNPRLKAPKRRRKRIWDERTIEEVKRLRWKYPNLGKDKIFPLLKKYCDALNIPSPKEKTIGRIIVDLGGLRMFPKKITFLGKVRKTEKRKVIRKPKDFKALYPGHCVAFDTVEKHIDGKRRYVITFEDIFTRFSFAWSTTSHASLAAKEFFDMCVKVFPFSFTFVLTDNGSEFKKYFNEAILQEHMIHYHTYPRTPKMNAHLERFNRTIQEEFVDYHMKELETPSTFNVKLVEWLSWYNTERVHFAFKNKQTPVDFMLSLDLSTLPMECKMSWPHTSN